MKFVAIAICTFLLLHSFSFAFRLWLAHGPQELREPSIILNTQVIVDGKNPYALAQMPLYTNVYGVLYHAIIVPFAKIFGSSFFLHRFASFIFLAAATFYFFKNLRAESVSFTFALIASCFLYIQIAIGGYDLLARPDSLGFLLFLLSIFLPRLYRFSNKGITLGILFSVLAFLTKPYFILGMLTLPIHLFFFVSKKKGIVTLFIEIAVVAVLLLLLHLVFETYLINTIFIHDAVAGSSREHVISQLQTFVKWNFASIIVGLLLLRRAKKVDYLATVAVVAGLIFFVKLGMHTGNFMTYLNHLFAPFFLFLVFKNIHLLKAMAATVGTLLLILNLLFWVKMEVELPNFELSNLNWSEWEELLAGHKNVLNYPAVAGVLYSQGKQVYDTGQTEFFSKGLPTSESLGLTPYARQQYLGFYNKIHDQLENKQFDMIMAVDGATPFFTQHKLEEYYVKGGEKIMEMYKTSYTAELWYPR